METFTFIYLLIPTYMFILLIRSINLQYLFFFNMQRTEIWIDDISFPIAISIYSSDSLSAVVTQ